MPRGEAGVSRPAVCVLGWTGWKTASPSQITSHSTPATLPHPWLTFPRTAACPPLFAPLTFNPSLSPCPPPPHTGPTLFLRRENGRSVLEWRQGRRQRLRSLSPRVGRGVDDEVPLWRAESRSTRLLRRRRAHCQDVRFSHVPHPVDEDSLGSRHFLTLG